MTQAADDSRKQFLWLAVGVATLLVANGRWIVPLASWLAPIGWLVFLERSRAARGLALAFVLFVLVNFVAWRPIIPAPGLLYYAISGTYALVYFLPFAVHRLWGGRIPGFSSTLVFPTAWVSFEYIFQTWVTPYGSWFSLAYTQTDHLALLQLAALTGHAGISFVMTWFAAVAVWIMQTRRSTFRWLAVGAYAAVLGLVLLHGQLRLSLLRVPGDPVRVAGLVPSARLLNELEAALSPARRGDSLEASALDSIVQISRRLNDDLFRRTRREARAGAVLVTWSETAARVLKADEAEFMARANALASEERIDLVLGYGVWIPDGQPPFENKLVAVSADGEIAWDYHKAHPIVGAESSFIRAGDRRIRRMETEYGVVSATICHDLDFPALVRGAHRVGTTILVGPSADWPAITPLHADMAILRAIENGFALLRPTSGGRSIAIDWRGKTLAAVDFAEDAMVAHIPTGSVSTLYGAVGDLFSWLCLAAMIGLGIWPLKSRRPSVEG